MSDELESNEESDVIVIGYGGAGAAAAITASDLGAEVLILEKMPQGGGNTALGASSFYSPSNDKVEPAIDHFEKLSFGNTPRKVIEVYVKEATKNKEWIEQLGGKTNMTVLRHRWPWHGPPAWPNIPGAESMLKSNYYVGDVEKASGPPLWSLLAKNVERRGIKVMTSTPAKELVTGGHGEVVGVVAENDGKKISIKATRAVILTSGGFAGSEVMRSQFLPFSKFNVNGHPGNTGDGIIMAQKAGAALWHMTVIKSTIGLHIPEYSYPFAIQYHSPKFIWINKFGRRFTAETGCESHLIHWALMQYDPFVPGYPQLPVYVIFDKEVIKDRLNRFNLNDYEWSNDNSVEIARGWIKRGNTIREIAQQIQVDEATLENTLNRYNENCKLGIDPEQGRLKEWLTPIDSPPYYAMELWPQMTNTLGGPRRDHEARVLDLEGQPIPRLYSAGELGSFQGFLYVGGTGMGEPLAVGRIAGRNAAAEKPLA